ncbi:MAG: glycosyltransferase [Promethearchaeota archaeon]|nr:MAG: glycosyltransferase [Candidatus Lokiarchaeota archaeon]
MIKLFIPVYNEERFIRPNLQYMVRRFSKLLKDDYKIYVVNDGSIDRTTQILDSLTIDNLTHLNCNGPTVRENLAQMFVKHGRRGDLIFFMDADLSTDMKSLPEVIQQAKNGYDIVIGSRYQKGATLSRTPYRFIVSRIFNLFLNLYFGSTIKDHECGFKLFKYEVIKDLIDDMGWNLERRAFWDSEMLIRAQSKGYRIKEVPVSWVEGPKSYISIKKEKSMIFYILNLKFRLLKENNLRRKTK